MANSAKRITATGDVTTGPTKLWGVSGVMTTAGVLTLRDNGAGGTVFATFDVPAAAFMFNIPYGMTFDHGLHVTFTTAVGGVTLWM